MAHDVIRKRIELNADDVRWYEEHYPNGSLSATLAMLLGTFREVNTLTPRDYARIAADAFNEKIADE